MAYEQPKTYRDTGGDRYTIGASGVLRVQSGGILEVQSGTLYKDTTLGINTERRVFVDKVALTGTASTAGGVGNWTAPTGTNVMIQRLTYHITTQSATAGCVLDIGTTSTSATTKSDNLLDGLVATGTAAVGIWDNYDDSGTNGTTRQLLVASKWITFTATGSKATALVGNAYVEFVVV